MFDVIETTAVDRCTALDGDYTSKHNNIDDCSLYDTFADFAPVPVEAIVTDDLGVVYPQRMKFHALQNKHSKDVVNVTPFNLETYKLTPHGALMREQSRILHESGLRDYLGNVEVQDRVYEQGLRVHRTIRFLDLSDISRTRTGQQDENQCRLDIFNSVDKTWSLQVFSGAYRTLCQNTLVFGGEKAYHQKAKHTKNMSTGALITKGVLGLEMWDKQADTMKLYREKTMTEKQFNDVLIESGLIDKTGKVAENNEEMKVNQRKLGTLLKLYSTETRELGETMWAAFNALTHWSTHLDGVNAGGRAEKKQLDREIAVRGLIESDAWLNFAGLEAA